METIIENHTKASEAASVAAIVARLVGPICEHFQIHFFLTFYSPEMESDVFTSNSDFGYAIAHLEHAARLLRDLQEEARKGAN